MWLSVLERTGILYILEMHLIVLVLVIVMVAVLPPSIDDLTFLLSCHLVLPRVVSVKTFLITLRMGEISPIDDNPYDKECNLEGSEDPVGVWPANWNHFY